MSIPCPTPNVALLISGHSRSIRDTINNIKLIKDELNCDVFLHYWKSPEMEKPSWRMPEKYGFGELTSELIESTLAPRMCLVEDSKWVEVNVLPSVYGNKENITYFGSHFMVYAMWRCFKMCHAYSFSKGISYDVIIRYRYDLRCLDPKEILLDVLEVFKDKNVVKMPAHNWAQSVGAFFDGVIVAEYKMYLKIISNLPIEFDKMVRNVTSPAMVFPELFIVKSIEINGASVKVSGSTIQIIRQNGKSEQVFKPCHGRIKKFISQYKTYRYVRSNLKCDPCKAIKQNWGVIFGGDYRLIFNLLFKIHNLIKTIRGTAKSAVY
jgi:hypothetical protein